LDRSRFITILGTTVFLSLIGVCLGRYSGGTGEPNDPYRIYTSNDLNDIGNHVEDYNKCFVMVNDINMAGYTGTEYKIIGDYSNPFTGVFDGNNHVISNLTITASARDYVGLFGRVYVGGQIKNLGLEEFHIVGHHYVGGLVGKNSSGSVTSCYATGDIRGTGWWIGGLVGHNSRSVTSCYATGDVSGYNYVGGLVGGNYNSGSLNSCYSSGTVSGDSDVGGLVGHHSG
jgi:hypothetical protein